METNAYLIANLFILKRWKELRLNVSSVIAHVAEKVSLNGGETSNGEKEQLKDDVRISQPGPFVPMFLCQRDSGRQNVLVQCSPP